MKNKKIIIISVALIIVLILSILLYINKNNIKEKHNISNSCSNAQNYYSYIIDNKIDDMLLISYQDFEELRSTIENDISIDKTIFTNNNYYAHTEEIDYCKKTSTDQILKDVRPVSKEKNEYDFYIKESCCENPTKKYLLLLIRENVTNNEDGTFIKHNLYNSCKEG